MLLCFCTVDRCTILTKNEIAIFFVECTIHGEERTKKENEFCKSAEFVHIREAHS